MGDLKTFLTLAHLVSLGLTRSHVAWSHLTHWNSLGLTGTHWNSPGLAGTHWNHWNSLQLNVSNLGREAEAHGRGGAKAM